MPYMVKRHVAGLGLKVGDTLDYEEGSLPAALKFDAAWIEPKPEEPKPEEPKPEEPKPEEPKPTGKRTTKK